MRTVGRSYFQHLLSVLSSFTENAQLVGCLIMYACMYSKEVPSAT